MQVERSLLHEALKVCKAGLADKHPLTALLCYWFGKETLTTYNEVVGIEIPLPFACDFRGGIPGAMLLGLTENSRAKNATITVDGGGVSLKLAGARAKLSILPENQAVWSFPPTDKKAVKIPIDDDLTGALAHVSLAVSSGEYAATGICFSQEDPGLFVYASDGKSLAYAELAGSELEPGEHLAVPALFCDQIVSRKEGGTLFVDIDRATAVFESGVRICSRILDAKPLDYRAVLNRLLPPKHAKERVPIPGLLKAALTRGAVLANGATEKASYATQGAELEIYVKTDLGGSGQANELHEFLKLEKPHPSCTANFDSAIIRRGLKDADAFLFTDKCFALFMGDHNGYVITTMV